MRIKIDNIGGMSKQERESIEYALVGYAELLLEALREDDGTKYVDAKYNNREIHIQADCGEFMIDDATLCMACGEWERTGLITSHPSNETLCESCERDYQKNKIAKECFRDEKAQLSYSYDN